MHLLITDKHLQFYLMLMIKYALLLIFLAVLQPIYICHSNASKVSYKYRYHGNFEDTRCRCICPSTEFFRAKNNTPDENQRRYYTRTNVNSLTCNTHNVVKESVRRIVDDNRLDAFLANCNCKFESRNSMLLKNVVLLVIVVLLALAGYMTYLLAFDSMLRLGGTAGAAASQFVPYRRQEDDVGGFSSTFWFRAKDSDYESDDTSDENVFGGTGPPSSTSMPGDLLGGSSMAQAGLTTADSDETESGAALQLRSGARAAGMLNKVEAEHGKWMDSVEEQRIVSYYSSFIE